MGYNDSKLFLIIAELFKYKGLQKGWHQAASAKNIGIRSDTLPDIEKGCMASRESNLYKLAFEPFDFDVKQFVIHCMQAYLVLDDLVLDDLALDDQTKRFHVDSKAMTVVALSEVLKFQETIHQQGLARLNKARANKRQGLAKRKTKRVLEMDRRSNLLALSTGILSGPTAAANLQDYLRAFDKNTDVGRKNLSNKMGKLGIADVDVLQQAAKSLYELRMRYGGGSNRQIALALLHEVSVALKQQQSAMLEKQLYFVMACLADTVAMMSWHSGQERVAQNYFQLALRASLASTDSLFATRILCDLVWQMSYLGKHKYALALVQLAQYKVQDIVSPQVKVMLTMHEAWAYAGLGRHAEFQSSISLAEDSMAFVKHDEEPYWVVYCDESELSGLTGGGLGMLARVNPQLFAERASEYNAAAIALRDDSMHRHTARDYLGLAETRFLLKDIALAVEATEKALNIDNKIEHRCGEVRRRLHDIYQYTTQASYSARLQALNLQLKSVISV